MIDHGMTVDAFWFALIIFELRCLALEKKEMITTMATSKIGIAIALRMNDATPVAVKIRKKMKERVE